MADDDSKKSPIPVIIKPVGTMGTERMWGGEQGMRGCRRRARGVPYLLILLARAATVTGIPARH